MFVFCSGSTPGSSAQSSEDEYEESNYVNQPVSRSDSPTFSFSLETSAQSLSSSFQMGLVNHWRPHRAFTFLHNDARPEFFLFCFFFKLNDWEKKLRWRPETPSSPLPAGSAVSVWSDWRRRKTAHLKLPLWPSDTWKPGKCQPCSGGIHPVPAASSVQTGSQVLLLWFCVNICWSVFGPLRCSYTREPGAARLDRKWHVICLRWGFVFVWRIRPKRHCSETKTAKLHTRQFCRAIKAEYNRPSVPAADEPDHRTSPSQRPQTASRQPISAVTLFK